MKAKRVFENIEFQRGQDPKQALDLGNRHKMDEFIELMEKEEDVNEHLIPWWTYNDNEDGSITYDIKTVSPMSGYNDGEEQYAEFQGNISYHGGKYHITCKGTEYYGDSKIGDIDYSTSHADPNWIITLMKEMAE